MRLERLRKNLHILQVPVRELGLSVDFYFSYEDVVLVADNPRKMVMREPNPKTTATASHLEAALMDVIERNGHQVVEGYTDAELDVDVLGYNPIWGDGR